MTPRGCPDERGGERRKWALSSNTLPESWPRMSQEPQGLAREREKRKPSLHTHIHELCTAIPKVGQLGEGGDYHPAIQGVCNYTSMGILLTNLRLWVYDKVDCLNVSRKSACLPATVSTRGMRKVTPTE